MQDIESHMIPSSIFAAMQICRERVHDLPLEKDLLSSNDEMGAEVLANMLSNPVEVIKPLLTCTKCQVTVSLVRANFPALWEHLVPPPGDLNYNFMCSRCAREPILVYPVVSFNSWEKCIEVVLYHALGRDGRREFSLEEIFDEMEKQQRFLPKSLKDVNYSLAIKMLRSSPFVQHVGGKWVINAQAWSEKAINSREQSHQKIHHEQVQNHMNDKAPKKQKLQRLQQWLNQQHLQKEPHKLQAWTDHTRPQLPLPCSPPEPPQERERRHTLPKYMMPLPNIPAGTPHTMPIAFRPKPPPPKSGPRGRRKAFWDALAHKQRRPHVQSFDMSTEDLAGVNR